MIDERNLLGSFATTVKEILADDDNIIQGPLAPQGTITIKAVYDAGKVGAAPSAGDAHTPRRGR